MIIYPGAAVLNIVARIAIAAGLVVQFGNATASGLPLQPGSCFGLGKPGGPALDRNTYWSSFRLYPYDPARGGPETRFTLPDVPSSWEDEPGSLVMLEGTLVKSTFPEGEQADRYGTRFQCAPVGETIGNGFRCFVATACHDVEFGLEMRGNALHISFGQDSGALPPTGESCRTAAAGRFVGGLNGESGKAASYELARLAEADCR